MKMKLRIIIPVIFIALSCLLPNLMAGNVDTLRAAKSAGKGSGVDSIIRNVKFDYQVIEGECGGPKSPCIKNNYSIVKKTVKVQFVKRDNGCNYKCKLDKNGDTLNVRCGCIPGSVMQHLSSYGITCKITGLSKGAYYLNYGDGIKEIIIK